MDKNTLSNYGWIVIAVLVLSVMIALATPFGNYVENAVLSAQEGLITTNNNAFEATGLLGNKTNNENNNTTDGLEYTITGPETISKVQDVEFRSTADFDKFQEVRINDQKVPEGSYSVREGSTIVTIFGSYIETLNNGIHSIEIISTNGFAKTDFSIDVLVNDKLIPEGGIYLTNVTICPVCGWIFGYDEHQFWNQETCACGCSDIYSATTPISLDAGDEFPHEPQINDVYIYEDYEYVYKLSNCYNCGSENKCSCWINNVVGWTAIGVKDNTKTQYGNILTSIAGNQVIGLVRTFSSCSNMVVAPEIPSTVTNMDYAFAGCYSLISPPEIPDGVISMWHTFYECTSLTSAPQIPDSVTFMLATFDNCTSLTSVPKLSNNIRDISSAFWECTSLTGTITINADVSSYSCCFYNVDFKNQNITLKGTSTKLDAIGATGKNYCANCNGVCTE